MNSISFQLFFLLLIIISINHARDVGSPVKVELSVNTTHEIINVLLRKIDSHLANENLPIYIVRDHDPHNLELFKPIMESIGKFSMYQDPITSSAAVLFEKENKFDGVIGVDYVLNRLNYIPGEDKLRSTEKTLFPQITSRFPLPKSNKYSRNKRSDKILKTTNLPVKTCQLRRVVAYIEILVLVDNSMIRNNILSPSSPDDYTPVVSHVLTLLNSVDMLYAKVKRPQIKINIAGIVIGERPETFEFLENQQCVETMIRVSNSDKKTTVVRSLDAQCTANAIGSYIFQYRNNYQFRNSFDNVIFLTGLPIHKYETDEKHEAKWLKGFQGDVEIPDNEGEKHPMIVKAGATTGDRYFGNYVAVAHELAHGFSVKGHDRKPYNDNNGNCCTFIMREDNNFCKNCLEWGPRSEMIFQNYFQSPASCIYSNEPKSLRSGAFKMMSSRKQCECYGLQLSWQSYGEFLNPLRTNICKNPLKCVDKVGDIVEPTYPMDGTPCGIRKVCWARECRKIGS